jgi:hypothetical protein
MISRKLRLAARPAPTPAPCTNASKALTRCLQRRQPVVKRLWQGSSQAISSGSPDVGMCMYCTVCGQLSVVGYGGVSPDLTLCMV